MRGRPHLRFLEFSAPAQDVRAALDFYLKLGFSSAEVGEMRPYPYAVVTDGRLCVGLHRLEEFEPAVSFVRPDLLAHLSHYESIAGELQLRQLGGDVFNEIGWRDPGGNAIRLLEARTFSPAPSAEGSVCGYFREIALPAPDARASKEHWERLGFVAIEEEGPLGAYASCTGDTLNLGLYDPRHVGRPSFLFETNDLAGAAVRLAERGVNATPGHGPFESLRFASPDGTQFLITAVA